MHKSYFLHGSTFCLSIYMSVSHKYVFENGLFQLNGGTSCLFTISIWQVTERVHVVYGSWFPWRYESLLRFEIGGPRFFPRVAATMFSHHILKVGIIVYFKYYIKYQVKMTRILLKFFIYPSCETALKNGTVISKIVRKSSLTFTFDQGSGFISEFLRSNSNNAALVRNNNLITIWYFSWWVLFVAWYG